MSRLSPSPHVYMNRLLQPVTSLSLVNPSAPSSIPRIIGEIHVLSRCGPRLEGQRAVWRARSVHPFNVGGMATLNTFPYQTVGWFDPATTASASAAASAAAGAGAEIMSIIRQSEYPRRWDLSAARATARPLDIPRKLNDCHRPLSAHSPHIHPLLSRWTSFSEKVLISNFV